MGTMANSEYPEEMPNKVSFRQGLHCLQRQNRSSEKEIFKKICIKTCHPSIYTMHHTDFIICISKNCQRKSVIIFLSISLNMCFGCSK